MPGSNPQVLNTPRRSRGRSVSLTVLSLAALLGFALVPSTASAAPRSAKARSGKPPRMARVLKPHACTKAPVEVVAGSESATFSLAKCDGAAIPSGIDQLSALARPGKPKDAIAAAGKGRGAEISPAGRRIDPRLVERLELVVDHFRGSASPASREHARELKNASVSRIQLVSGYRPRSAGSYHATGRALDFRIDGVKNEELVAFCKTLPDTGCGYYPNSMFVHMDVRDRGAGHVAWIDASHPGEPPHYVSAWPEPADADEPTLPPLPANEHAGSDAPESPKADRASEARRFQ
jgi:hypothetical protein